jgi:dGTPase
MTRMPRKTTEQQCGPGLAPYAAQPADSLGRRYPDSPDYRNPYQRDRDRVIHSTAFRRLEYKTQVFVNHEGDSYRTRLTHTLEVAQIARSIARALGLNEDLTEAVALAHDLGHTPFGHSGEDALRELMKDHGGFEHNLQGLWTVDNLELRYPGFPGLNLTYEVRESMAKHHTRYDEPKEKSYWGKLDFDFKTAPLLEAQIVDISDAVAYDSHDVDDGITAGLITEEDLSGLPLFQEAVREVEGRYPNLDGIIRQRQIVRALINVEVTDVLEETARRIRERGVKTTADVRGGAWDLAGFSPERAVAKKELEDFLLVRMYRHHRVRRMAIKAGRFVRELFEAYVAEPQQLPPDAQKHVEEVGLFRGVCDYIAGMTDRYAQDEYKKLFYPYELT